MLNKLKNMLMKKDATTPIQEEIIELTEMGTEIPSTLDTEKVDEIEEDDDYISDEEWEKMTPEQKAEFEEEDDEDDEDYISDEEWDKMTPAEQKAWEEEEQIPAEEDEEIGDPTPTAENVGDDDDPDYIKTSPEVVGFDTTEQQRDMYDIATEEIEPGESILDFGCGRGDLYDFLYRKDGEVPTYKGIDINEPLINVGIEKYAPDINIECKDWSTLDSSDISDWCVNIGSLCTRYDGSSKSDEELVTNTIDKMMSLCKVGSVLILFSSYMPDDVKEEEFLITDPTKIFDYVMKKYGRDTGNVILDHAHSDSAYKLTILKTEQQ